MRRFRFALAVVVVLTLGASAVAWWRSGPAGEAMTDAAGKFLASLSPEQTKVARLPYDDKGRTDWHFIPKPTRKGLQIREMEQPQRQAAHALLKSALSQVGYDKATKIMELENILRELEKGKKGGNIRDPERYYFTVFGEPKIDGRWGLSVEGHHLSFNFVVDKGEVVSSTPACFCANPALVMSEVVPEVKKGTRVLAQEELLAFELLASLGPKQRQAAVIADKAPAEIRDPGTAQPPQEAPVGLPAAKLEAPQKSILKKLIETYAGNMPDEVAQARLAAIQQAGEEKIHFAWAGADKPGIGHYYRVQGPTFLIEFVNTQPDAAGNPANHIHSVWRDMRGDFGVALK